MAVAGANSEVLEIGDVWATTASSRAFFTSALIGKVATFNHIPSQSVMKVSKWQEAPFYGAASRIGGYSTFGYNPVHNAIVFTENVVTPAVKTFPYLTRSNGKARLQLVFKEMKHNGTTWGDHDNTFNIVDNVTTTTDGNGQSILVGQKYAELPYFIGGGE